MYDLATRYRAVVHYERFLPSLRSVANIYGVSKSSLQRWVTAKPETKRKRPKRQLTTSVRSCIEAALKADPFISMTSLTHLIASSCKLNRSVRTTRRFVKASGWTRKKAFRVMDHSHSPDDVMQFCGRYLQAENVVCIDEAGFYVGDHCRYGYSKRGSRLALPTSKLRRSKLTLILAVSSRGVLGYEVLDHNCRKPDFVGFIQRLAVEPGSTLVMDNVQFHHSAETAEAIRAKGCVPLYTLPYSPKLNAIEYVFSSLKHVYRRLCPPGCCGEFDYLAALELALATPLRMEPFFSKVRQTVVEAAASGGAAFTGYD